MEELRLQDRQRLAWANANLAELYLLSLVMKKPPINAAQARKKAAHHAEEFAKIHVINGGGGEIFCQVRVSLFD